MIVFLLLLSNLVDVTNGFVVKPMLSPLGSARSAAVSLSMSHKLVLLRHGESTWNKENRFTGWVDCPLSEQGEIEAKSAGMLLKAEGLDFDVAYTSTLKRAIKTLWIALEEMDQMYTPIVNNWRFNERHYGALQGLNKQETVDKHGKEQVLVWRRSYDIPPPSVTKDSVHFPGNDKRYKNVDPDQLPLAESLALTEQRFMTLWETELATQIKSGKTLLIAAHGNTLRALVKHLDGISPDVIASLNIPTGVPLVYELDDDLKPIPQTDAIAPLQGRYLGDQNDIQSRIGAVMAQTK